MSARNQTDMGGAGYAFLTTRWSLIEGIRSEEDQDRALINRLLQRYWKPVYCYLRRKGHDNEDAKDLTQGFFYDVVLNRSLVERADPSKGRFRAFLLHALDQYLINEKGKQMAQKRFPKGGLVSLDTSDLPVLTGMVSEMTPEDSFHYAWLSELLEQVLSELEIQCRHDGLEVHMKVFRDRVIQPILEDSEPPSLAEVCQRHGLEHEKKASNMVITVKRRFQMLLRKHVRDTVATEDEVEGELQEIFQYLT
jgi:RNA polymerase sigma-70 factor (ECF subfamily)